MQLKTQKGSVIKCSKYGVGKDIGGCIYFHKDYRREVGIPSDVLEDAMKLVLPYNFNCMKWNRKTNDITFFCSLDFDFANEPTAGGWIKISVDGIISVGTSHNIWHHKWLWVKDDYKFFDREDSFNRSERWLKIKDINFSKIGNKDYWYPLLKKHKIEF